MTKNTLKEEAIARMKEMDFNQDIIEKFKSDIITVSEDDKLRTANFEELQAVKSFEKKTGNLVYHIIKDIAPYGQLANMLVVSKFREDWYWERKALKRNSATAFVINYSFPSCSEMGQIQIKIENETIKRLY